MIQVRNLTKRYGKTEAVRDISFSIEKGEIVGFLGPNGAGKTTTMRMLSCFMPPTRGSILIGGLDAVKDSLEIRRKVGYLPETVPLYDEMRVVEYLEFRSRLRGMSGSDRRRRLGEVLEQCGLEEVSRLLIGRLSKGYRQRVGLADCLIHDPSLLILDEPTIGLDPNQIRQVRSLIKNLSEKRTVLLSTHILSEVEMTCGRVLIMNQGQVVASDTPDRLVGLLKGNVNVVAELRGDAETAANLCRGIPGVLSAETEHVAGWDRLKLECDRSDVREKVFHLVVEKGWDLRELRLEHKENLEDVFVAMTRGGSSR